MNGLMPYVSEKGPVTNRIRSHFARIKAAGTVCSRCHYWARINRKTLIAGRPKGADQASEGSGHVGAVGWGDHAAHHAAAGLGVNARAAHRVRFQHAPGSAVGEQSLQHRMIDLVATTDRTIGAEQRQAGQREVADHVESLVAGAFVSVAQPFGVEQPLLVEYHGILERGAKREAGAPEPRDIVHAAEGAGAANLP